MSTPGEIIITLPEGYNGNTIECYATPLEILDDQGLAKLRVVGSTYLIKFIRLADLEAFLKDRETNK